VVGVPLGMLILLFSNSSKKQLIKTITPYIIILEMDGKELPDGTIFHIQTLKSLILKNLFEVIKPYIKETNMLIAPEFIKISTLDMSGTTVTYVKLDKEKFESYYCPKPIIIGLDTTTFFKAIKTANRRETITFNMNARQPDKLNIELADSFIGKIKRYGIPLLNLDEKIANITDMDFDCIINMPTSQFQQIIKDVHLLEGKFVEIKSVGRQLIFSSTDGLADFQTSISEIDGNNEHNNLIQQSGEDVKLVRFERSTSQIVQGKYQMSHLMNFIKASHLCENMNILLTNDQPLVLEYFVADLGVLRLLLCSMESEEN
jgi:proliferating cell nuclear antigen